MVVFQKIAIASYMYHNFIALVHDALKVAIARCTCIPCKHAYCFINGVLLPLGSCMRPNPLAIGHHSVRSNYTFSCDP